MLSAIRSILRVEREAGFEFPGEAGAPWWALFPAGTDTCGRAPFVPFSTTASAAGPSRRRSLRAATAGVPWERIPLGPRRHRHPPSPAPGSAERLDTAGRGALGAHEANCILG